MIVMSLALFTVLESFSVLSFIVGLMLFAFILWII